VHPALMPMLKRWDDVADCTAIFRIWYEFLCAVYR
jgi:hypothetical protein